MEVYRIAREKYAGSIVASGKSARWNKDNQFVVYTGQSRALSALELVVHRSSLQTALKYCVMVISLSDKEELYTILNADVLPLNWRGLDTYPALQDIGSNWYTSNRSLILKVPSALVPLEFNFIINTNHPDYSEKTVKLLQTEDYFWDERLLT